MERPRPFQVTGVQAYPQGERPNRGLSASRKLPATKQVETSGIGALHYGARPAFAEYRGSSAQASITSGAGADRRLFRTTVDPMEERLEESRSVVRDGSVERLGLADAAISVSCRRDVPVLTDDLDLYVALLGRGVEAVNLSHVRPLNLALSQQRPDGTRSEGAARGRAGDQRGASSGTALFPKMTRIRAFPASSFRTGSCSFMNRW